MLRAVNSVSRTRTFQSSIVYHKSTQRLSASSASESSSIVRTDKDKQQNIENKSDHYPDPKAKKTLAQIDEETRAALEGRAGDGGLAGAELEGGKVVGLKRGVRDNMFRYI